MKRKVMMMLLFFVGGFSAADACSCMPRGTTGEEVAKSDFVAKGKLVAVDTVSVVTSAKLKRGLAFWKPKREYFFQPMVRAKFVVDRVYKGSGATADTVFVLTNTSSAACGYHFSMGKMDGAAAGEYLLYASNTRENMFGIASAPGKVPGRNTIRGAYYTTGLCMATQPATAAEEARLAAISGTAMGKKQ